MILTSLDADSSPRVSSALTDGCRMRCVDRRPRSTARALTVLRLAAVLWAAAIPLAAATLSGPAAPGVVRLTAALPYAIGAVICHQQSARSFALWSQQLPVCARCTGIYVGAAITALAMFI